MKWGPCLIAALVLLAIDTADGFSGMMPLTTLGRSVSLNGPPRPLLRSDSFEIADDYRCRGCLGPQAREIVTDSLAGLASQPKLALGRSLIQGRATVSRAGAVKRAAVVCMAKPSYEVSVTVKRASGSRFLLEGSFLMAGRCSPPSLAGP